MKRACAALVILALCSTRVLAQTYAPGFDGEPTQAPPPTWGQPPSPAAPPTDDGWQRQPLVLYLPAAPEPRAVYRPITGLWVAGMVVLAATWLSNIAFTGVFDSGSVGVSAIPVAGPFVQLGDTYTAQNEGVAKAMLGISGAFQLAGAAMLIVGLSVWRKRTVYERSWSVAPFASPTGGGAAAAFRF